MALPQRSLREFDFQLVRRAELVPSQQLRLTRRQFANPRVPNHRAPGAT